VPAGASEKEKIRAGACMRDVRRSKYQKMQSHGAEKENAVHTVQEAA
jgi:hypothetical protein